MRFTRAIAALLTALLLTVAGWPSARASAELPHETAHAPGDVAKTLRQDDWIDSPSVQSRLARGGVAVRSVLDGRHEHATVEAAIRIHTAARVIWPLITQCRYAAWLISGLKRCRVLRTGPRDAWAIIEHEIKYSWFLPTVRSVFRAEYQPPREMDFHRVAGNLKYEVGSWKLSPSGGGATTVVYRISLEPGFWVPRFLIRRSLYRKLPAALRALRRHARQIVAGKLVTPATARSKPTASGASGRR